jgi:hypothetical protein
MIMMGEKLKYLEKKHHFFYHSFYTEWPGIKHRLPNVTGQPLTRSDSKRKELTECQKQLMHESLQCRTYHTIFT